MELAINEVKTQAKKLLKAMKINNDFQHSMQPTLKKVTSSPVAEIKLKHCLTIVSQQLGFDNWHHAKDILSGSDQAVDTLDMGSFLYPDCCGRFLNEWHANYQQAKNRLSKRTGNMWLLPYKKQFIVVKKEYIDEFKLNKKHTLMWADIDNNMVGGYNTLQWDQLASEIIKNRPRSY